MTELVKSASVPLAKDDAALVLRANGDVQLCVTEIGPDGDKCPDAVVFLTTLLLIMSDPIVRTVAEARMQQMNDKAREMLDAKKSAPKGETLQ